VRTRSGRDAGCSCRDRLLWAWRPPLTSLVLVVPVAAPAPSDPPYGPNTGSGLKTRGRKRFCSIRTDGTEEAGAFFVDVIGPGFARPGNECLFRAVPKSPGVPPFTYQWNPPASGTVDFAHAIMPSGVSSVMVTVDVWDGNDAHSSGHITVQLNESNDPCGI